MHPMRLYYAFGSGLGHLCRCRAIINTFGLSMNEFIILTNSAYADLVFKNASVICYVDENRSKPDNICLILEKLIRQYNITELYIDSFPYGIKGELNSLNSADCRLFYIARILNWDSYSPLIESENLMFEKTFIFENLSEKQNEFVLKQSCSVENIKLIYPESPDYEYIRRQLASFKNSPWLIVHSGNSDELQVLFQYASDIAGIEGLDPEYLIISQVSEKQYGAKIQQINYFPASDFFPYAAKIFTACGFNSMYETEQYAEKHYFIPFDRRFDDQYFRSIQRRQKRKLLID